MYKLINNFNNTITEYNSKDLILKEIEKQVKSRVNERIGILSIKNNIIIGG